MAWQTTELADYGARPVEIEDVGIATRLSVSRTNLHALVGNEGNREGNEGNREGNVGNREGNEGSLTTRLFNALKRNPKASIVALAKDLSVSHATVERAEKALQSEGRIRRKGGTRGVWEILDR